MSASFVRGNKYELRWDYSLNSPLKQGQVVELVGEFDPQVAQVMSLDGKYVGQTWLVTYDALRQVEQQQSAEQQEESNG